MNLLPIVIHITNTHPKIPHEYSEKKLINSVLASIESCPLDSSVNVMYFVFVLLLAYISVLLAELNKGAPFCRLFVDWNQE